ncbi:tetratricopeptide repeat protein, partial [Bacteroidota bacterium]
MKQSFSVIFRTIILFAFLLNINVAFGQKENLIDSLKNRLMEEMPDSTRFNTLILLGKEYFNTGKPEIAIEYANKAEKLEKKIKIELTGYQHYLLGRMYNELGLIDKSLSRFLSSIEGLRKTKNSEKLFDVYYRSANIYRIQFDFINELKILEEIKGYSEESGMIEELAKVYFEISNVYQRLNDFDQELVYLNKFSEISESLENDKLKSNVHYRKGEIHFINKEYSKAIEEYKNAIEYYPDDNLSPTIFAYLRIAFMYYLDKDLDNSLVIYEKVLLMCENTSRLNYLINAYGNLGTIYRDIGDYKKAEEYYLKAIDLAKNKDDYYSIWWIFKDMSIMYISKNDYKLAYKYYKLSED